MYAVSYKRPTVTVTANIIQEDTVGCTNLKDGNAVEMDRRYQHPFLFRQQITR